MKNKLFKLLITIFILFPGVVYAHGPQGVGGAIGLFCMFVMPTLIAIGIPLFFLGKLLFHIVDKVAKNETAKKSAIIFQSIILIILSKLISSSVYVYFYHEKMNIADMVMTLFFKMPKEVMSPIIFVIISLILSTLYLDYYHLKKEITWKKYSFLFIVFSIITFIVISVIGIFLFRIDFI